MLCQSFVHKERDRTHTSDDAKSIKNIIYKKPVNGNDGDMTIPHDKAVQESAIKT